MTLLPSYLELKDKDGKSKFLQNFDEFYLTLRSLTTYKAVFRRTISVCLRMSVILQSKVLCTLFLYLCTFPFNRRNSNLCVPIHYKITLCLLTYLLTYSMEQSPSWETNLFAVSQEIPCILWNPNVYYRIHNCPPLLPILSQLHPSPYPHI